MSKTALPHDYFVNKTIFKGSKYYFFVSLDFWEPMKWYHVDNCQLKSSSEDKLKITR